MEPSDDESFDEEPMVLELDNEAECRNNYKNHLQLLVHPKPTAKALAIPKTQTALKKNGKLVKVMLKYMRDRKHKKPFNIEKCHQIHARLKTMYSIAEESDPDTIRETVGMSKKTFKKAVGSLYKKRLIALKEDRIEYLGD